VNQYLIFSPLTRALKNENAQAVHGAIRSRKHPELEELKARQRGNKLLRMEMGLNYMAEEVLRVEAPTDHIYLEGFRTYPSAILDFFISKYGAVSGIRTIFRRYSSHYHAYCNIKPVVKLQRTDGHPV
jgi:hypothetical protein